jgi:hypothetical protein
MGSAELMLLVFGGESGGFQVSLKAKLDLWICTACKGIIEGRGGGIMVGSEVGTGMCLWLCCGILRFIIKYFD